MSTPEPTGWELHKLTEVAYRAWQDLPTPQALHKLNEARKAENARDDVLMKAVHDAYNAWCVTSPDTSEFVATGNVLSAARLAYFQDKLEPPSYVFAEDMERWTSYEQDHGREETSPQDVDHMLTEAAQAQLPEHILKQADGRLRRRSDRNIVAEPAYSEPGYRLVSVDYAAIEERVRIAQEIAWDEGYDSCAKGTQRFRNPYRKRLNGTVSDWTDLPQHPDTKRAPKDKA